MKIQPNVTPNLPNVNFGKKRASIKLPNGLKVHSQHIPKGLLYALITLSTLVTGTIVWKTSDYYKLLKQFEQLLKDIQKLEIQKKDSKSTTSDELPADTISMADAIKLNEIG